MLEQVSVTGYASWCQPARIRQETLKSGNFFSWIPLLRTVCHIRYDSHFYGMEFVFLLFMAKKINYFYCNFVQRYIYWTDWTTIGPSKIERSRLDGSERKVFLNITNNGNPAALTYDYETENLYWCDKRLNKVYRVSTNQTLPASSTLIASNVTDCVGLALYGDHVYWLDA